jgi:hypothetical protein
MHACLGNSARRAGADDADAARGERILLIPSTRAFAAKT